MDESTTLRQNDSSSTVQVSTGWAHPTLLQSSFFLHACAVQALGESSLSLSSDDSSLPAVPTAAMAEALALNMSQPRFCTDTLLQAGSALQALLEVQPPPTCAPTAVFGAPYIPAISALPLATLLALLHACDLAALPAALTDSVTACLAQRYASQPVPAFQAEVATPSPRAAALVHAWWEARFGAQQGALARTHPEARHWRAHLASPTAWAASYLPFYPALPPVLPPIAFGLQAEPPAEELWVRGLSGAPGQPPPPHPHTAALLALTFGASHWAHVTLPAAAVQHTAAVLALAQAAAPPEDCAASLATLLTSSTEDAALTQLCCAALWRLALQPQWCSSSPAAPAVLAALLGALAAHPHHSGIATAGCAAAGHLLRAGLAQAEVAAALLPGLPTLTAVLCSPALAPEATEEAAACFRRMLSSEQAPPTAALRACPGALPRLVELLQWQQRPSVQFQAAWALTNMASGCAEDTAAVAAAGALPPLVALLDSPDADVREQAAWALGNTAGDSLPMRAAVLAAGALPALLRAITPATRLASLRTAVWTLSNLVRCKAGERVEGVTAQQPPLATVRPMLPRLAALVSSCKDAEVLHEALWALFYLSEGGEEALAAVLEAGCTQSLAALLGHESPKVQLPAMRILGNLLSGEDALAVRAVLNAGALPAIAALLAAPGTSKALRKEACWALSNACDSAGHTAAVLQCPGLLPQLLAHARPPHPLDTAREACWALRNAVAGGSAEAVAGLVAGGALEALVGLLQRGGEGPEGAPGADLLAVAMEAVAGMLQKQGGSAQQAAAAAGLPLALMQLTERLPSWHEASRLAAQVLAQHFPQVGELGGLGGGGFAAEMLQALPLAP